MVRAIIFILLIFLFCSSASAETAYRMRYNNQTGRGDWVVDTTNTAFEILVCEIDGDPCKKFSKLIFANDALIDNGDGSVTIDIAAVPSVAENIIFSGENIQFDGEDVIYYP
jgi:hypothetical protein